MLKPSSHQNNEKLSNLVHILNIKRIIAIYRVSTLFWKTLKTWNFVIFFSRPGKCLEFAQKASLFKMAFTKIIMIYFFVISTLSTQTLIRSQIELGFHCFYLEITRKIHGILCHKKCGNPASVLTHFEIFITKI